jgi:cell division protein FtsA
MLCQATPNGVKILKSERIQQQHYAMRSGVIQNVSMVISNVKLLYNELTSELEDSHKPTKIILGVAGEIVNGEPIMVSYDRKDNYDAEITEKEEIKILEDVREKIISSGTEELADRLSLKPEDIIPLHIDLSNIEIGNLRVNKLHGHKGRSLKLFFCGVFAPYTFVESLIKVAEELNLEIMTIVAQPFAVAKAYKEFGHINLDAIFIDIGGGTTDIAVVNKGNIVNSYMFAYGSRVFTKKIQEAMNLDYRFAEKRKLKYSNKNLPKNVIREVKEILRPEISLWMDGVRIALSEFKDLENLPEKIYLCGGGSLLPDIREKMLAYPWKQHLNFIKHPKTEIIKPDSLADVIDQTGNLNSPIDVTPCSIARYAWTIQQSPEKHLSLKL